MAITKIHAIKSTVQKSVDYICNPHKTDNRILVDSFACGIETAELDFQMENASGRPDANPAYHVIQSFAPGEVTFEEAHAIGKELADRLLHSTHPYVLTTHVDKEHVHNHLIFCSTDMISHARYNDCMRSYRHLRSLSDTLCKEHHLSVIIPDGKKGMNYKEWEADKKNTSVKQILRRDIFECIRLSKDYEDFLRRMMEKGYQIKGYEISEEAPKYISFKPPGYGNFIRGSLRSLGKGHTKEEIINRIEKQVASRLEWKIKQATLPLENKKLIILSPEKADKNPNLEFWVERENLKITAAAYASVGSYTELLSEIKNLKEKIKENRSLIISVEQEKKILSEKLHYLKVYKENKPAAEGYRNSKDPESFLEKNESRLLLFEGARSFFQELKMNPEELSEKELSKRLEELETIKSSAGKEIKELKTQLKLLTDKQKTLEEFLHLKEQKEPEKPPKRRHKNGQEI